MNPHRHRRTLAAAAACLSLFAPAGALAAPSRAQATAAPSRAAEAANAERWKAKARYYETLERTGTTPASQPIAPAATHDSDDQLATILPGVAVLVALAGGGYALLRTRSRPRGALGRLH